MRLWWKWIQKEEKEDHTQRGARPLFLLLVHAHTLMTLHRCGGEGGEQGEVVVEQLPASRICVVTAERGEEEEGKGCFACMHDAPLLLLVRPPRCRRRRALLAWKGWKALCLNCAWSCSDSHPPPTNHTTRDWTHLQPPHHRMPGRSRRAWREALVVAHATKSNPLPPLLPHSHRLPLLLHPTQWSDNSSSWPCCQQSPWPLWVSASSSGEGRKGSSRDACARDNGLTSHTHAHIHIHHLHDPHTHPLLLHLCLRLATGPARMPRG